MQTRLCQNYFVFCNTFEYLTIKKCGSISKMLMNVVTEPLM